MVIGSFGFIAILEIDDGRHRGASIHQQRGPGDVARLRRGEVHYRRGNFLRQTDARNGKSRGDLGRARFVQVLAHPVGGDARRYREILGQAMDAAGFINYPQEWWHWSHGDRYWAFQTSAEATLYGPQ